MNHPEHLLWIRDYRLPSAILAVNVVKGDGTVVKGDGTINYIISQKKFVLCGFGNNPPSLPSLLNAGRIFPYFDIEECNCAECHRCIGDENIRQTSVIVK